MERGKSSNQPKQAGFVSRRELTRDWKNKADERIRTADPFITSEVLYQLSYVGACRHPGERAPTVGSYPPGRPVGKLGTARRSTNTASLTLC